MERAEFLEQLREKLRVPAPANLPHPLRELGEIPTPKFVRSLDDPVAAFTDAATTLGVRVQRPQSDQDVRSVLADIKREHQIRTAVISKDPETEVLEGAFEELGIERIDFNSFADSARADLGITGAAMGIAATGTLVMHPDRAGGRSSSLLPAVHLCLLKADRIVKESSELFLKMDELFPHGMPSQLVLASGPSRSGDIESVLTVGVHGPGHVWVAIVD